MVHARGITTGALMRRRGDSARRLPERAHRRVPDPGAHCRVVRTAAATHDLVQRRSRGRGRLCRCRSGS